MAPFSLLHQLLCEGEGWGTQERWGIGASGGPTRLRLPLPHPPAEGLTLTLEVAAPADAPAHLRLRTQPPGQGASPWFAEDLPAGSARPLRLDIPPCEAGDLIIEFDTGPPPAQAGRPARLFFTGLMLCGAADREAQLRYLSARSGVSTLRPG